MTIFCIYHQTSMYFEQMLKSCFLLFLVVSFLYLLAWPSLVKYQKGGVFVEEERIQEDSLPAPAVTVCAMKKMRFWKQKMTAARGQKVLTYCHISNKTRSIIDCVNDSTFTFNETIQPTERKQISLQQRNMD